MLLQTNISFGKEPSFSDSRGRATRRTKERTLARNAADFANRVRQSYACYDLAIIRNRAEPSYFCSPFPLILLLERQIICHSSECQNLFYPITVSRKRFLFLSSRSLQFTFRVAERKSLASGRRTYEGTRDALTLFFFCSGKSDRWSPD